MFASDLPASVLDPSQSDEIPWKSTNVCHTHSFSLQGKGRERKSEPRV